MDDPITNFQIQKDISEIQKDIAIIKVEVTNHVSDLARRIAIVDAKGERHESRLVALSEKWDQRQERAYHALAGWFAAGGLLILGYLLNK